MLHLKLNGIEMILENVQFMMNIIYFLYVSEKETFFKAECFWSSSVDCDCGLGAVVGVH